MIKIALDAGHGLKTIGKQTPDGIKEWTLNDKIRDKVVAILRDYDVEIIHTDNNEGNTDETLSSRVAKYKSANVSVFVSIHHNAFTGKWNNATGVEVYTDNNPTAKDIQLANLIYSKLVKNTGLKGRGVKKAAFTVINQNSIPAVLVEGGFMDSTNDYKVITSEEGQNAYAKAVAEGIIEFANLKKKEAVKPKEEKKDTTTTIKNNIVLDWQKAAIKDGFSFPKYGADGKWGSECENVAAKAICKKRVLGYKNRNLTKIIQGKVGVTVDGKFGNGTKKAVIAYQKKKGLTADGAVGLKTWKKILEV